MGQLGTPSAGKQLGAHEHQGQVSSALPPLRSPDVTHPCQELELLLGSHHSEL